VAHANIIRYFISRALGDSVVRWARISLLQGSLSVIAVGPGSARPRLMSFNDVGHLPRRMCTFL
jgi:broad specificity phosphatase PhoE